MNEWQYTRSGRRHWVEDGHRYKDGSRCKYGSRYYLEIVCCSPYNEYPQKKHGYDLFFKGQKVLHAETVKEIKKSCERKIEKCKK